MEHDSRCEKSRVLKMVRQRMNMNLKEMAVLHEISDLCFCAERKVFGDEWTLSPSGLVDRLTLAVEKVLDMRSAGRVILNQPHSETELRMVKWLGDSSGLNRREGKVIPVDFQARKRIAD